MRTEDPFTIFLSFFCAHDSALTGNGFACKNAVIHNKKRDRRQKAPVFPPRTRRTICLFFAKNVPKKKKGIDKHLSEGYNTNEV